MNLAGGGGDSGTIRGTATINTGGTLQLSTGDATGYIGGASALTVIHLVGGTLDVNTSANQTLGSATINMTGGAITGNAGGNLDFFGGGSALNTFASSTTATISGVRLSPLRQGSTTFTVAAGSTPSGIDLDISSVLRTSPSGDAGGAVLTKDGPGTMRLTAENTYARPTTIAAGTLLVNGSLHSGSAVTISSAGKLGGTGTVAGGVVVSGTLAPGAGVGTLNTGAETWNGGGSYEVQINNATGAEGTGWDLLNITGALTVNANSGSKFTIKVVSLNGSSAGACANFDKKQSHSWRIATASGVSGFAVDAFTLDTSAFSSWNDLGSVGAFSVSKSGNDIFLNFTPVFANAASYGRAWGTYSRLSVSSLLDTYTTGNGERELVRVAAGDGGTVPTVSGGLILLAPSHNLSETYRYEVKLTGYETSLATNFITLSVTNAFSAVNSISNNVANGTVTITFAGVPNFKYVVERSSDLSAWEPVQTKTAPAGGVWTFTDGPDPAPPNPAFYRLRQNN